MSAAPGATTSDAGFLRATRHINGTVTAAPHTWLAAIRLVLTLHDLDVQRRHGELGEDAYRVRLELAHKQASDEVWCVAVALALLGHEVFTTRQRRYLQPTTPQETDDALSS